MTKKAVIIAAGMGRRLGPHTQDVPKCLVPVRGRPILLRQLDAFRAHGIDEIVVVRGYRAEVLEARRAELGPGVRFVENRDFRVNNILESMFCADGELAGPFLSTYADIIFTADVVERLLATPGDIALVIDRDFAKVYAGRSDHPMSEAEVTELAPDGRVAAVGKRAVAVERAWGEFIGLARFSAEGARAFTAAYRELRERYRGRGHEPFQRAPSFRQAYLTDLLQHLIDGGVRVVPVPIHGQWREIDTVQDLERAEQLVGW
jgi:L-glutamine-phosphate cytidylyltransferase